MKLFIKNISLFLIFSIAFYIASIIILGTVLPQSFRPNIKFNRGTGHTAIKINEIKNVRNIDILFIGSSHAYRSFDTRFYNDLGLTSFNLGTSAQTPIQSKLLLNRYLKDLNPKILIFEVSPQLFCSDGIESSLDIISNDKNDLQSINMSLKNESILSINTSILAVFQDLLNSKIEPSNQNEKKDTYIKGGFVERDIEHYDFKKDNHFLNYYDFKQNQFNAFEDILAQAKDLNIKVILVQTPIAPSYYNSFLNKSPFNKRMHNYGEYYDFNKTINLNDSIHFYDLNHMNQNGVDLFNPIFIKETNLINKINNLTRDN